MQTYFSQAEDKVMNVTKLISHYFDLQLFSYDFHKFLHGLVQMCKFISLFCSSFGRNSEHTERMKEETCRRSTSRSNEKGA